MRLTAPLASRQLRTFHPRYTKNSNHFACRHQALSANVIMTNAIAARISYGLNSFPILESACRQERQKLYDCFAFHYMQILEGMRTKDTEKKNQ